MPNDERRFERGYYSRADAARLLGVPSRTVGNWVRGYRYWRGDSVALAEPLIVPPGSGQWLSFVNLVEAHSIAAFRASGVSMQGIRPALAYLADHLDLRHPLASQQLLTDGAELFFRYLREEGQTTLVVLLNLSRGGQLVFNEVVERYLRRVDWATDGYPARLWPAGRETGVAVDPRHGFGQPVIARRSVRVEDVAHRLLAGEPRPTVADEFGLSAAEVSAAEQFYQRMHGQAA